MTSVIEFLSALFPSDSEPIHLRFIKPRETEATDQNRPVKLNTTRAVIAADKALQRRLQALNQARGAYVVVNAGGDCDAAITGGEEKKNGKVIAVHPPGRFNACFVESDKLTIEEQHEKLDACPLPPSIRIVTKKSVHAYWHLDGDNPGDRCETAWREVQERLIAFFDGDPAIKNPSRVMRLPGFDHVSADGSRKRVECVVFDPERRYTLAELLAAFPPAPEEKQAKMPATRRNHAGTFTTWGALRAELGRRIEGHESARRNDSGKIDCRGICHDGKGATGLFYDPSTNKAICNKGCDQGTILRAFALPESPSGNSVQSVNSAQQSNSAQQPEEWGLPVPFREYNLPTFPVETLPSWLRSFVEQEAEATQTPDDLAALQSLATCAATVAGNIEIEARRGWIEPLNIFTLVVLESANRKSTVVNETAKPLERYEADLLADMRDEIAAALSDKKILEARLEKAQKDCAKLNGDALYVRKEEAKAIAIELENHVVPVAPRFFVDDVTAETLASKMAEQGGRMALFSAEGGIFETMAGRYSNGAPNIDVYLKGHAGDSLRVDRRDRSERIDRPALTIGLAVQSDVIRGLAQKPGFRGRGLLGRILYSLPLSRLGARKSRAEPLSEEVRRAYERNLIRMVAINSKKQGGKTEPIMIQLSREADGLLAQFQDEIEPQLAEGGDLASMSEWAGKLCGAVVRLAGILHVANYSHRAPDIPSEVPAETFKRALAIGRYLIPHAQAAHAEMGADPLIEDAKYVLRWLKRERLEFATRRDIHVGCRGRFRKVTELEPVLTLLEEHNFIRPLDQTAGTETRRGRKASQLFEVNPRAFNAEQNSHNTHNVQIQPDDTSSEIDYPTSEQNSQFTQNCSSNGNSAHSVNSVHMPVNKKIESRREVGEL